MKANTHIGEALVRVDDKSFLFRPSLENIAEIGTPAEIVQVYASVVGECPWYEQLTLSINVLYACATDFTPELERLLGGCANRRYTPGQMPPDAVIAIARQMMRHGVVGKMERPKVKKGDQYSAEFNAVEMAALAQAHLNVSIAESWSMTMTSLVRAMAAKFPLPDSEKAGGGMTVEDNDAAVAWLAKVNKQRGAKRG